MRKQESRYEQWLRKPSWKARLRWRLGWKAKSLYRRLTWEKFVGLEYDENGRRIKRQPKVYIGGKSGNDERSSAKI